MSTRIHDRKMRLKMQAKQRQERAKDEVKRERLRLFQNAHRAVKGVLSIDDFEKMSLEKQSELLTDYVEILNKDIAEFSALYPNSSAVVTIRRARDHALNELARLRVSMARGDTPMKVP